MYRRGPRSSRIIMIKKERKTFCTHWIWVLKLNVANRIRTISKLCRLLYIVYGNWILRRVHWTNKSNQPNWIELYFYTEKANIIQCSMHTMAVTSANVCVHHSHGFQWTQQYVCVCVMCLKRTSDEFFFLNGKENRFPLRYERKHITYITRTMVTAEWMEFYFESAWTLISFPVSSRLL